MTVITCPIDGTYLIRDETFPIAFGSTATDQSVVVQQYRFGWVCGSCGYSGDTTRPGCDHIKAAQASRS